MRMWILLFCCFLAGCHKAPVPAQSTLKIAFNTYPTTLNPQECFDFTSSSLVCLLFEGLAHCTQGSEVELAITESVDVSPDQTVYTFHLRPSYWNDGSLVTAEDFARGWFNALNPDKPSPCAYLFYAIQNAENYVKRECEQEAVGIRVADPMTLVVTLVHPTPYFLSLTAFPTYRPCPPFAGGLNGPFLLGKADVNHRILLQKNPMFWNAKNIHLDAIHISIIPDELTGLRLFENHELDLFGGALAPLPLDLVKGEDNLLFTPMLASTFCTFNTAEPPFSCEDLRKAFMLAIDWEGLFASIEEMGGIPATSFMPPALLDASVQRESSEKAQPYLERALRSLRMEARDLEALTLYYKPQSIDKRLAQMLQEQWQKRLGIAICLEQLDPKSLLQKLQQKQYKIALGSWIAQFHDPVNILERFKSKTNLKNYPVWENGSFIECLDKASQTLDRAKRLEYLHESVRILEAETAIIPLYHWRSPLLIRPNVEHLCATSSGALLFEYCKVNPEQQLSSQRH